MSASLVDQVAAGHAPDFQRWTASQIHRMRELGILEEGSPTELIDGLLVRKDRSDFGDAPMTHGKRHAYCVRQLQRLTRQIEDLDCSLQTQLPIEISDTHEPEPDAAIMRGALADDRDRLPPAADVFLAIEVSGRSLEFDRTTKQRVYATALIREYWIINLRTKVVEVYSHPAAELGAYQSRRDYQPGETLRITIDANRGLDIAVEQLLP